MFAATAMVSAAPFIWNSSGVNQNWSTSANWLPTGQPGLNDSVLFDNTDQSGAAGTADNIVDVNFEIDSLWYAATNISPTFNYHNTEINAGVTLTVSNNSAAIVLDSGTQSDPALGKTASYGTISGAGTLVVNDTNSESVMIVSQGSSTYSGAAGLWGLLDMSGLGWFDGTFGRLLVGVQGVGATPGEVSLVSSGRQSGILSLAITNSIHLTQTGNVQGTASAAAAGAALVINDSPFFGDYGSTMYLGQSNAIWADTITVGRIQCSRTAVFEFNPAFSAPEQLYLRGESSNRVSELVVADNSENGGACNAPPGSGVVVPPGGFQVGSAGLFDVSAGTSDMMIDTLIVGKGWGFGGGGYAAGIFNMGAGTLNVNTLQLGVMSGASEKAPVTGTFNIFGGSVTVNSGPVALGVTVGSPVTAYATGSLNITGGSLNVANGAYGINDDGLIESEVGLTNAIVTTGNIGSVSAPIGNLTMADSTLNLTLNGLQGAVVANNLTTASTTIGNTINITLISGSVGVQSVVTLIQSDNPIAYAGSFTGGANGSDFVLGTLPAGYQGHLQVNPSSVQLVLTQTPLVINSWTGADIATHNTNWSDGHNWTSGAEPTSSEPAFFVTLGSVGSASTINNIVDSSTSILGLEYVNTNGTFQNTWVPAGVALTVGSGGLTAGSATVDEGNTTGHATISGPGGIAIDDSSAVVYVGLGHSNQSSTAEATLDMSGLGLFDANVGNFLVGVGSVGFTSVLQPVGTVYLAETNVIMASSGNGDSDNTLVAIDIGDAGDAETHVGFGDTATSTVYLGETNAIFADYIDVGRQWANGSVLFNPAVTSDHPSAYIRGLSASAVTLWNIGDAAKNAQTFGAGSGTVDLTGGTVNALVDELNIGISSPNSTTASSVESGTLTFDAGVISAATVTLSDNPATGSYDGPAQGTLNVNGTATLVVSGTLNLGATSVAPGSGTPTAKLNINGGSAWVNTLAAAGNGTVSDVSVNGGLLGVTNGVGTTTAPLTSLNLTNATIAEAAGTAPFINAQSIVAAGSSNVIRILALPSIEVYPATIVAVQSATAISGGATFQIQVPANVTGAQLSESADHTQILLTVQSGPVTGRGIVYWVAGGGANVNWSDAANWFIPPIPAAPDTAYFDNNGETGAPGAGNADNVVNVSDTIAALWYAATNPSPSFEYHNTVINAGITLTVSNNGPVIVLDSGTQTDPASGSTTSYSTVSGAGALDVIDTDPASLVIVSQGNGNYTGDSGLWASLDLSGLNTFNSTSGRLFVGVAGVGVTPGQVTLDQSARASGQLTLALTNAIHLTQPGNIQGGFAAAAGGPALVVLDASAGFGDVGSSLSLGQSNALWADSITIGRNNGLQSGVLQFNPNLTGQPEQFYLRGESGARVEEFVVADATQTGNASQYEHPDARIIVTPQITGVGPDSAPLNDEESGLVDLSEGTSDIMIDQLVLGLGPAQTLAGYTVGQFNLGAGKLDVNTLTLGVISSSSATFQPSTGILNVSGGTVIVNDALVLGVADGAATTQMAAGDVSVTNGALDAANIVASGSANSTITLSASTLSLTSAAGSVGTVAAPVGSITLLGGTMLNLAVGSYPAVVANSITASGTSDTINLTALPLVANPPQTLTLIKSVSGAISGYDFVLGTVPAGFAGHIQKSTDGTAVQLVVTGSPSFPTTGTTITSASVQNGSFVLSGTNGVPNGEFEILSTTNLSLPAGGWVQLSTGSFDGNGDFNVTVPVDNKQQFFIIKSQ
jgi:fibronectin-binding autotransporter adhesin